MRLEHITKKVLTASLIVIGVIVILIFVPILLVSLLTPSSQEFIAYDSNQTANFTFLMFLSTFTIVQSIIMYSSATNMALKYGTPRKTWFSASLYSKFLYISIIGLATALVLNPLSVLFTSDHTILYNITLINLITLVCLCYGSISIGFLAGFIIPKAGKSGALLAVLVVLFIYSLFLIQMLEVNKSYITIKILGVPSAAFVIAMAASGLVSELLSWLILRNYSVAA